MPYAIRYFRDAEVVKQYRANGVYDKPVGYVVGQARYDSQMRAQRDADHINALYPRMLVTVIRVS